MNAKVKKKNVQDATLINVRSIRKKLTALEMRVKLLENARIFTMPLHKVCNRF